jgi:hypothetical protein
MKKNLKIHIDENLGLREKMDNTNKIHSQDTEIIEQMR